MGNLKHKGNIEVTDGNITIDGQPIGGGGGLFIEGSGINSTLRDGAGTADGNYSTVGGGLGNSASDSYSTVGGGFCNAASGYYSTIGGGCSNTASCGYSTVGGGLFNTASGCCSTVGGGFCNTASGFGNSTVGGGRGNTASGAGSTVGGGQNNTASGCYTGILGGRDNDTNNLNCATIIGSCITAIHTCTAHVNCLAIMNIPTDPTGLCAGMVWNDGGTLKIVT